MSVMFVFFFFSKMKANKGKMKPGKNQKGQILWC